MAAAIDDAADSVFEFDGARAWIGERTLTFAEPLAVEVWVFDPRFGRVLLVEHRWRGAVPPGGAAEPGELPRDAARRELLEETGLIADLEPRPAAVAVRAYKDDWPPTLGLSYASVVDETVDPAGEPGQPARWAALDEPWDSVFPDDRPRILRYAAWAIRNRRP